MLSICLTRLQRYNWDSHEHEMRKIKQIHRASVVTKDRAWALSRGERLKNSWHSPPVSYTQVRIHAAPTTHLGRRMGRAQSGSIVGDLKTTCKQDLAISWWLETGTSLLSMEWAQTVEESQLIFPGCSEFLVSISEFFQRSLRLSLGYALDKWRSFELFKCA